MMKRTRIFLIGAVLLATFAALTGYGQTTAKAAVSSKDALAVLNKMIEAMGGRKALEAVKDTTMAGTVEITQYGITAPLTIYAKEPNKVRVDVTIAEANITITQAYNGEKGWITNPQAGTTEEMPDFMIKQFAREAMGNMAFLDPQKAGITYALKPKAAIDGKDYIVLEQTYADGYKATLFLDPVTYLPYKEQGITFDQNGAEADTQTFPSDYRKVGGMMIAHAQRVVQNGSEAQRITITSVTFNTNLDDAFFVLK
jgi:outer membrane lipoprotein-sorting protein